MTVPLSLENRSGRRQFRQTVYLDYTTKRFYACCQISCPSPESTYRPIYLLHAHTKRILTTTSDTIQYSKDILARANR